MHKIKALVWIHSSRSGGAFGIKKSINKIIEEPNKVKETNGVVFGIP